ncbi:MAG TPA: ATP-binding protein, partial [Candidatus Wallbacteria bacterium]|nr:ATP-binding protein [Candidatus Wallbacteria bacterium]
DELTSNDGSFTKSNETADLFSHSLGGALVYVINSSGITVASSNRKAPDSLLGHNYKFRKYFQDAVAGKIGEDLNKGITTNKRGYYVCAPVKGPDGKIIGAAAIKSEVEDIEKNFSAYENCFFISSDGIIFISSISDLLFTPMWPLSNEKLDAINASRKFGAVKEGPLLKKEIFNTQTAELGGMKYYVNRSNFSPGWDIALFSSYKKAAVFRLFGITISCVIFILILNFFVWIQLLKESAFGIYLEKERLATILKSIGEGVIVVGTDLKILMINETARNLLEAAGSEIENKSLFDVFVVKDLKTGENLESCSLKALTERRTVDFGRNSVLICAAGEKKHITATAAPVIAEDRSAIGAVIAFKDITNIKKMDEELLHINQIKSIGTLAGGIAHDFNNLLLAINCNIELMRRYFNDREKFESSLSRISEAVFKAKSITAQFITFARGGKPLKKTADPALILKKIISFTLGGTKIAYEFNFSNNLRFIDADEAQLNQAFSNIAINACHAMPEGGMLKITAENVFIDEETAEKHLFKGDFVKISFVDTGCGIAPEDIDQIFNPYFTTKSTGMGLGLTSVYSIVKSHGGFIKVSSSVNIGTKFDLFFPSSAEQPEKSENKAAAVENAGRKIQKNVNECRVLLMDDEPLIRQTAVQLLNHIGFKAECACDGNEAIQLYRKSIADKAPYEILIMDLTVPGGMGGVETIKILKQIDPEVTAIASSGYFDSPSISNYSSEGFAGFIAKPYKIHDLNMLIKKTIKEKYDQLNKKRMEKNVDCN